ncbi:MAG: anti-sigma F factor [Clostridiales bacterium]|nr:anti-sigma F factor [Clostridiales bacterium]
MENYLCVKFPALPENESLARIITSAFILKLNPTLQDSEDIKTAVSEAVTNSIIHGYSSTEDGEVELKIWIDDRKVYISVKDSGEGIEDIDMARRPFYTSKPELDRSGMGFTIMESFMDEVKIDSKPLMGTIITMTKIV